MNKKINNKNWKIWEKSPGYGENLYYKRAIGKLGEMESSKALCRVLRPLYKKEMKLLDVGCGAGHYLRSFQARIDKNIDYTGLDATKYFIRLAKMAFGKNAKFMVGDVFNLPFEDNSFDIVNCSNVILHLPPPPKKAISEMLRVAKKYVVIRTVFGERNYIIREVRGLIDKDGNPVSFNFFNMYAEKYFRDVISEINKKIKIKIIKDNMFKPFDNRKKGGKTATRIVGGKQTSGNLILDWRFIILKKP